MVYFLFLLWVIFNGRFAPDVIILGIVICAAINWFAMRYCKWYVTKDWRWRKFLPGLGAYCVLLVKEIILANLAVIKLILDPKLEEKIHPQMVKFPCHYRSDIMKALLANSITLTPGTITVRVRSDHFIVHALTPEMGENMDQSDFYRLCAAMDEYTCKPDDLAKKEENSDV